MEDKIRLGVSACLLGEKVRYDGGHKLDHFIADTLGAYVEFVPVCRRWRPDSAFQGDHAPRR